MENPSRERAPDGFQTISQQPVTTMMRTLHEPPFISDTAVLFGTVLLAGVFAYLLIFRTTPAAESTWQKDEPEQYFQAVVSDIAPLKSWSGREQRCEWSQTDGEVEVLVVMPTGAKAKDVACRVLATSLRVVVQGQTMVEVSISSASRTQVSSSDTDAYPPRASCLPRAFRASSFVVCNTRSAIGKLRNVMEHERSSSRS